MSGVLLGLGGTAPLPLPGRERPSKEAKALGVNSLADAGRVRPVSLARPVRSQRRTVKMPRTEPSVLRRLLNCSATETIAVRPRCQHVALVTNGHVGCSQNNLPKKLECVVI